MKPNFKDIEFSNKNCGRTGDGKDSSIWNTPEQIPVKALYTAADLEGMEHLDYAAGIPPYLRGPYSTMYVQKPWTIRQYAGFSTSEPVIATVRVKSIRPVFNKRPINITTCGSIVQTVSPLFTGAI